MPFIVDKTIRRSCLDSLKEYDANILFSFNCMNVYPPVNTHPDIQIHFVNNDTAFVPPELYGYYKSILPANIKLHKGNKSLGGTYPGDIAYNISRIGMNAVCNLRYADEEVIKYYKNNGFNMINVNQGYAKCNICTDGTLAATEDEGIYFALIKNGIETLKLPPGSIMLPGFPYGFIGGASGTFKNKLLFCGKMENKSVTEFFRKNKTEIISLDKDILTDYGSIIYFE